MRHLPGLSHAEKLQAVQRFGVLEVRVHEVTDLSLGLPRLLGDRSLQPLPGAGRGLTPLLHLGSLIAHLLHQRDQLGLLLLARQRRDLLGRDLRCLREPEDFSELLVKVGQFCHGSPWSSVAYPPALGLSGRSAHLGDVVRALIAPKVSCSGFGARRSRRTPRQ